MITLPTIIPGAVDPWSHSFPQAGHYTLLYNLFSHPHRSVVAFLVYHRFRHHLPSIIASHRHPDNLETVLPCSRMHTRTPHHHLDVVSPSRCFDSM